ncbi:MAG TPA: ABC transporter permease [Chloroflexota bacterium]|jgi:peptide/nickel transport system permease protein|nr:ABC transporter permease [Chloroflexota bacterium]
MAEVTQPQLGVTRRPAPGVVWEARPSPGYLQLTWRRFRRDHVSMAALGLFLLICAITLAAPLLVTHVLHTDPNTQDLLNNFAPPSPRHWLGTDELGRDTLARVLYAGQVSLRIGLVVAAVSLLIGVPVGLAAGYYGGRVDDAINAVIQVLQNIPGMFLLIILSVTYRPDPTLLAAFIGFIGWMGTARLVRGQTLSLARRDYIDAARVLGASDARILFRHILPNLTSVVTVIAGFEIATGILLESGLSYLGLGVQPPTASWGNMLQGSLDYVTRAPWLVAAPGAAIFLTVLSIFLLADGLRDAFDPRMRG